MCCNFCSGRHTLFTHSFSPRDGDGDRRWTERCARAHALAIQPLNASRVPERSPLSLSLSLLLLLLLLLLLCCCCCLPQSLTSFFLVETLTFRRSDVCLSKSIHCETKGKCTNLLYSTCKVHCTTVEIVEVKVPVEPGGVKFKFKSKSTFKFLTLFRLELTLVCLLVCKYLYASSNFNLRKKFSVCVRVCVCVSCVSMIIPKFPYKVLYHHL